MGRAREKSHLLDKLELRQWHPLQSKTSSSTIVSDVKSEIFRTGHYSRLYRERFTLFPKHFRVATWYGGLGFLYFGSHELPPSLTFRHVQLTPTLFLYCHQCACRTDAAFWRCSAASMWLCFTRFQKGLCVRKTPRFYSILRFLMGTISTHAPALRPKQSIAYIHDAENVSC